MGAELRSLVNLTTGEQYVWQADPDVWAGSAPILFPIIGALKDGRCNINGQWYPIPKHGLARHAEFSLLDHQSDSCTFSLTDSQETLRVYPWSFELQVKFVIEQSLLTITYEVMNRDSHTMFFNLGSHPAFNLSAYAGGTSSDGQDNKNVSLTDFTVVFSESETLERYQVLSNGLLSTRTTTGLNGDSVPLNETIFEQDALVFKDIRSNRLELSHRQKGPRVAVTTGGAPHLGIWAKPAAPFVCIEPWWGTADFEDSNGAFFEKPGIQSLEAGEKFLTQITIETFD